MALRAQIDPNTVIVENLNTSLSAIDRSTVQKINKEAADLLHTLAQIDIVDIYRIFHPTASQYIFFFGSSWNFLQNRSYIKTKNKSRQIQENQNNSCIISNHTE
jgi:hypothetical protein